LKSGNVFRLKTWVHVQPKSSYTMKVQDKRRVAVMMLLGYEARDGSAPLDLHKAMRDLGWVPAAEAPICRD
jgi:hypothetical protein